MSSHTRKNLSHKRSLARKPSSLHRSTFRRNSRFSGEATIALHALLGTRAKGGMSAELQKRYDAIHAYTNTVQQLLRRGAEVDDSDVFSIIARGMEYFPVVRQLVMFGAQVNKKYRDTTMLIEIVRMGNQLSYILDHIENNGLIVFNALVAHNGHASWSDYIAHEYDQLLHRVLASCTRETLMEHDANGRSALFLAMKESHLPVREHVMEGEHPGHAVHAILKRAKQLHAEEDVIEQLVAGGVSRRNYNTNQMIYEEYTFMDHLMECFIYHYKQLTWTVQKRTEYTNQILAFARSLLRRGKVQINLQNKRGETALIRATRLFSEYLKPIPDMGNDERFIRRRQLAQFIELFATADDVDKSLEDNHGFTAMDILVDGPAPQNAHVDIAYVRPLLQYDRNNDRRVGNRNRNE